MVFHVSEGAETAPSDVVRRWGAGHCSGPASCCASGPRAHLSASHLPFIMTQHWFSFCPDLDRHGDLRPPPELPSCYGTPRQAWAPWPKTRIGRSVSLDRPALRRVIVRLRPSSLPPRSRSRFSRRPIVFASYSSSSCIRQVYLSARTDHTAPCRPESKLHIEGDFRERPSFFLPSCVSRCAHVERVLPSTISLASGPTSTRLDS